LVLRDIFLVVKGTQWHIRKDLEIYALTDFTAAAAVLNDVSELPRYLEKSTACYKG